MTAGIPYMGVTDFPFCITWLSNVASTSYSESGTGSPFAGIGPSW